jgi:hypothetical protein
MKIAILAWGSLVWDPGALRLAGSWMSGGPILPIEFSRVSDNGRLTLVIDERHGVDVPTRYAFSALDDLNEAITDLQKREGTPVRNRIGFVDVAHDLSCDRALTNQRIACARIRTWAKDPNLDAVVWTGIGPRFRERTGTPFSVDAAVRYLACLEKPTRTLALDYIRRAPPEVVTPVRSRVDAVFGLSQAAELLSRR